MIEQLALDSIARTPGVLSIDARYDLWRRTPDGETVYREFVARALRMVRAGWSHYSHKAIVETIRYDHAVRVGPEGGFRINDHYTSRLAREAIGAHPELTSFFDLRELRA